MAEASQAHIEVDPVEVDEDHDSVISDDVSALTASITSSILDYPVENGRRYHAFRSGVYCLPNDELEQDRLDLSHLLMTKAIGDKLFLAPIDMDKTQRVLDIGTGTGICTMAMGDEYPNAEILGNDLSAIQPPWVPPNVKFEIDDVECPWVYSRPFDFIFCRYMAACIKDWPKLVGSVYDNLSPGGWAEFQDFDLQYYSEDGSLAPDSHTAKWIGTLLDAARKTGREPCPGPKLEEWVREAGFTKVTHQRFRLPIGAWPKDPHLKEVGTYNMAQVMSGLEAFSLRLFCGVAGWSKEEVLALLAMVRRELKSSSLHAQFDFHVVYGQKPEQKE
ncbi:S-adenosyl-L-methionine-dependent methyltransferase [Canariomyces notabilis]|uniref:S-adenosyl-L-methionine-dependent methyltransferase n=1 Tax=Canariomyces notabilis TaxID=2074819 RepID=A0AAN6TC86_9PEZI|nr:S-adenosyl-L-methionine-dependent methyltransferase [Canariomyces arenarius]